MRTAAVADLYRRALGQGIPAREEDAPESFTLGHYEKGVE